MRAATVFGMIGSCEPRIKVFRNNKKLSVLGTSGYGSMRLAKPTAPLAEENRRIDLRFLVEPHLHAPSTGQAGTIPDTREIPVQTEVRERYEGE